MIGELLRKRQPVARKPTNRRQNDLERPLEHRELAGARAPAGARANTVDRRETCRLTQLLPQLRYMLVIGLHRTFGDAMRLDQEADTEHGRVERGVVVVTHRYPERTAAELLRLWLADRGAVDRLDIGLGKQYTGIKRSHDGIFGRRLATSARDRDEQQQRECEPDRR